MFNVRNGLKIEEKEVLAMGFGAEKWEWVCAGGLWRCGRTVIQRFVSDRSVAQSEELHLRSIVSHSGMVYPL